ncbi:MAG: hypothetical protein AAFN42_14330 [Cyanobacteria bacterium J06554_1]
MHSAVSYGLNNWARLTHILGPKLTGIWGCLGAIAPKQPHMPVTRFRTVR